MIARTILLASLLVLLLAASCTHNPDEEATERSRRLAKDGAAAFAAKDFYKAQQLAAEAANLDPEFAEAWVANGMALVRLGKSDEAKATYVKALELYQARQKRNPADADSVVQQIFLLTLLGRPAEAKTLLDQAHTSFPADPQIGKLIKNYDETRRAWESLAVSK